MTTIRMAIGLALGLLAAGAQAQAVFGYNVSAQQGGWDGPVDRIESGPLTGGPFATPGTLTASQGASFASFTAVADPRAGLFKALATARVEGALGTAVGEGWMGLTDTLRFSGPDEYAQVDFTISWDTRVSGVDLGRVDPSNESGSGFQGFSSTQYLKLERADAPPWSPGSCSMPESPDCTIIGYEPAPPAHELWGARFQYGAELLPGGAGDGRYSGQQVVSFTVPTGVDLLLDYSTLLSAACVQMLTCNLVLDASHSDYLGLALAPGVSFTSANDYQYLGKPLAVTPVPEPATLLLALAGLALVTGRARRRD